MKWQAAAFESAFGTASQLTESTLPEFVFSGRSNVGKSSLLNKILGRKSLARVSSMPGKTITINFYRLPEARLVDLPGYGYSKRSLREKERWAELVEGYFAGNRKIALVLQLIDIRHPCSEDDLTMLRFLMDKGLPFGVVFTKSDKLNKTQRAERLAAFEKELGFLPKEVVKIPFSSANGEGVEDVRQWLEQIEKQQTEEETQ